MSGGREGGGKDVTMIRRARLGTGDGIENRTATVLRGVSAQSKADEPKQRK